MAEGENHLTQADKEVIRATREYQEKLARMTLEEREAEEKRMEDWARWLHLEKGKGRDDI